MQFFRQRLFILATLLCLIIFSTTPAITQEKIKKPSRQKRPATLEVLSIDNGTHQASDGGSGNPGFGWFNQLIPDDYPATLNKVQIAFSDSDQGGVPVGSPIKIEVFLDPNMIGLQNGQMPDEVFNITVNDPGNFENFDLPTPLTITSGAVVVGALDSIFVASLPAFINVPGLSAPSGAQSYYTLDNGMTYANVNATFPGFNLATGSWLIRAVVDVPTLQPVIKRAFYRNNKLRIIGRNFTDSAKVRINGKRVDLPIVFQSDAGKLVIKGSPSDLNLNPMGQSNTLVIVVDGVASDEFQFST
jgi:hypothetical protein